MAQWGKSCRRGAFSRGWLCPEVPVLFPVKTWIWTLSSWTWLETERDFFAGGVFSLRMIQTRLLPSLPSASRQATVGNTRFLPGFCVMDSCSYFSGLGSRFVSGMVSSAETASARARSCGQWPSVMVGGPDDLAGRGLGGWGGGFGQDCIIDSQTQLAESCGIFGSLLRASRKRQDWSGQSGGKQHNPETLEPRRRISRSKAAANTSEALRATSLQRSFGPPATPRQFTRSPKGVFSTNRGL